MSDNTLILVVTVLSWFCLSRNAPNVTTNSHCYLWTSSL